MAIRAPDGAKNRKRRKIFGERNYFFVEEISRFRKHQQICGEIFDQQLLKLIKTD